MAKRQPHSVTRDLAEQRKRRNDTQPISIDRREAEARQEHVLAAEQWDEIVRLHIPGIALSGMPRIFELPVVLNGRRGTTTKSIGDRATDQSRWSEIPDVLIAEIQDWDRPAPTLPDGWTYEGIIPANTLPDQNDEPNPRTYTLSGQLIRTVEDGNAIRMKVCSAFDHRLSELFRLSPNNTREKHVTARLQHHFDRGGNPTALLDYMEGLATRWEADPPTYHDVRHYLNNDRRYPTVADAHILTRAIRQWVEDARKAPTSAMGKPKDKPTPPPTRTIAERLDAKPGAREAFDTMLLIDGSTNKDGQWILTGRKGRAEVVAAWDAVVEIFGVEGYAKEEKSDKAFSAALREYIPGLTIGDRPNKLRNTSKQSAYTKARKLCEVYMKERRDLIIAERSDTSE